jgi:ankyrin repeat protein
MLHREALAGNANIVAMLLAHGAKRDAKTRDGRTALELAKGWPKVESLLR